MHFVFKHHRSEFFLEFCEKLLFMEFIGIRYILKTIIQQSIILTTLWTKDKLTCGTLSGKMNKVNWEVKQNLDNIYIYTYKFIFKTNQHGKT